MTRSYDLPVYPCALCGRRIDGARSVMATCWICRRRKYNDDGNRIITVLLP